MNKTILHLIKIVHVTLELEICQVQAASVLGEHTQQQHTHPFQTFLSQHQQLRVLEALHGKILHCPLFAVSSAASVNTID